jgi:hypothetical protein
MSVLILLSCLMTVPTDGGYQVKVVRVEPPQEVSAAIRAELTGEALQVFNDKGELHCEFWFRQTVPAKATPEQVKNGLTYRELEQTTLIGVVRFPRIYTDYRRQDVPAGVYTLRFVIQPQSGDHAGSAPFQEFCLLSDAKTDVKLATMEVKDLIEQSAAAIASSHPTMMLLFPQQQTDISTKMTDEGRGHWVLRYVLQVHADGKPAKLGIGVTVAGLSPIS